MLKRGTLLRVVSFDDDTQWIRFADEDGNLYEGVVAYKNGEPTAFIFNWHTKSTLMDSYGVSGGTAKEILNRLVNEEHYLDASEIDPIVEEILNEKEVIDDSC